jgi:hypothetical protein
VLFLVVGLCSFVGYDMISFVIFDIVMELKVIVIVMMEEQE